MVPALPITVRPTVSAVLALVVLVLGATWCGSQNTAPLRVNPFLDRPGLTSGLHLLEQSPQGDFRWTTDTARVCAPQAGRAARSLVEVRLAGAYALALGLSEVRLQANAGPVVPIALTPELRRYQILSGVEQQPAADLCATISAAAVTDPNNNRRLGVPFYGCAFRQLLLAGPVVPAPAQLLINLSLVLLTFGGLRLLGVPTVPAAVGVTLATLVPTGLLVSGLMPAGPGLVTLQWPLLNGLAMMNLGLLGARRLARCSPLWREVVALVFWSVVLLGGLWMVQMVNGHANLWPLKAGFFPHLTLFVLLPIALCVGWLWLLLREPLHAPRLRVALLLIGAVAMPVALEVSVLGWDSLYTLFRDSPYDYVRDTVRVGNDPLGFLRHYVALIPQLALHGKNHPPGSVLLLWLVERIAGPGPIATSWAAILLSALLPLAAFWLGVRLGDLRLGLLAGAITTLLPGYMIYAVTSMDGVFNTLLAFAMVACFLALEPPAHPRSAVVAGVLLALGLGFTYATTQLGFFGLIAAALALLRRPGWASARQLVRQGLLMGGVIGLIYTAIFLLTGFNVVQASAAATAENAHIMARWLYGQTTWPFLPPSMDYYLVFLGANLMPYVVYLSPWGLTAMSGVLLANVRRGWQQSDVFGALLVALGGCVASMWLSGLFIRELERIWGFTYPLAAVLIAHHALNGRAATRRWRPWLYLTLCLAFSVTIKLLLNTFW